MTDMLFPAPAMPLASAAGAIWTFAGKFHAATTHFPVALIVIAAVAEGWALARKRPAPAITAYSCLWFGALGAIVAAALGWANAGNDISDESFTVSFHRWSGISLAGLALITACIAATVRRKPKLNNIRIYRSAIFLSAALVTLTGFYGGMITHGESHYVNAWKKMMAEINAPTSAAIASSGGAPTTAPTTQSAGTISFERDIFPIFEKSCVECHSAEKQDGEYRLDTLNLAMVPGELGIEMKENPIIPGNADKSPLVIMIEASNLVDYPRMPPKGKKLDKDQVALIRKWINEGAK